MKVIGNGWLEKVSCEDFVFALRVRVLFRKQLV